MKRARYMPTEAELRAAHGQSALAHIPFERAMADKSFGIVIRVLAEIRARQVPAMPEPLELTP